MKSSMLGKAPFSTPVLKRAQKGHILVTGTRDVVFAFKYIVLENNIKLFLIIY